jgi:5'-nucleotidase
MLLIMQNSTINILHFNDVYNIEERVHPAHGDSPALCPSAARFVTAMESRGSDSHLVLFSGDLFAPSNLGAHFKGEQML